MTTITPEDRAKADILMVRHIDEFWLDEGHSQHPQHRLMCHEIALALSEAREAADAAATERAAKVADEYAAHMNTTAAHRDALGKPNTVALSKADAGEHLAAAIRSAKAPAEGG